MENTSDNQSTENSNSNNPEPVNDFNSIFLSIKLFLFELLDIRSDTDRKGTIEDIKGNISMKGHTAWVLVFQS